MPYKDRDKYLSSQKAYYNKDKAAYKWRVIENLYGLSKENYLDILEKQNHKCSLCKQERKLQVDHCHETGKIRGLLCLQCNVGLGMLGDNKEGLEKALQYVKGEVV